MNLLSKQLKDLFKTYLELNTSLSSGEHYSEALKLLENFLSNACGFKTEIVEIPEKVAKKPNRKHLIARKNIKADLPTILIYNHIDVVPADYVGAFTFREENGVVYSRGASDHKGSTIAILDALEKLAQKELRFNLIFWATTDEETDQLDQLRWVTKLLKLAKNTVVFDPDTFAGGITIGHLGLLQLDIEVKGKSAHSGMSNMGINAVEAASKLICEFFAAKKIEFEAQASAFPTFASVGIDRVCSRCNVNKISGGIAANVVPDSCIITVDCRFIPEADVEKEKVQLLEELTNYCLKNKIVYEVVREQLMYGHAGDHILALELNEKLKEVSEEGGMFCVMGSTPLAHWAAEEGLPHFGLGVARADSNIHGVNEKVKLKDIETLSLTMQKFLL